MKAITLYEPWASLISIGAKINETRPNRTSHRGDICIHAAQKRVPMLDDLGITRLFEKHSVKSDTFGCIIAVVELWDVQPAAMFYTKSAIPRPHQIQISQNEWDFGNYGFNRWIYRTRNLRRLKTPVPAKGFQCVGWTVPPDVEALVRAQLK